MINPYIATIITLWFVFAFYFPINRWEHKEEDEEIPEFIRF